MKKLLIIFSLILAAGAAQADSALKSFRTGDDSRGWEAVGRLDFAGRSFCTGTLITERLVLTAAHCMFDIYSKQAHQPNDVTFRAGWRNGQAQAYRTAKAIYVHPGFSLASDNLHDRLVNDVALVELSLPVRNTSVRPFPTSVRPEKGQAVGVVSYAHDRAESPSLQEVCHVMARQGGVLVTSCEVDFGSSGAPIFDMTGAVPRIVSVVSAKANFRGERVSVGTSLDGALADLLQMAATGQSRFKKVDAGPMPALTDTKFALGLLGQ
ncbi:trypsin-like serine peptidase [Celeribacter persicus]|jgi:V8-like Glu-specific endopeptidase|uniref:V8-like Glu-specific endopeptidase n=1 Tax=Celeribacter persicus TaxID=1651082 RepID=A0A2T5HWT2_9RHOB|nr:trypsin-like serine protease [Celeribacter persicus]PTQ75918.1 V8-like Glu-specific endopeptidase [Celeribacter persicus]